MEFFKNKMNFLLSAIIFILIAALICSMVVIKRKNDLISDVKLQISQNEEKINEADKQIKAFEAQIAEKDKANAEVKSQLEKIQAEKNKLQSENSALKKKIETLSANKNNGTAPVGPLQNVNPSGQRVCYLTFDDGPSSNTLKILDILKRYNVKATFFVINTEDVGYVKRIHNEGHTVGLHTASHKYNLIYKSTDMYFKDLQQISDIVYNLIGVRSTVMRFPGGSSNGVSKQYCYGIMSKLVKMVSDKGYSYFDWNVDSNDANVTTSSYTYIRNSVLNQAKNKNSICVLMHDSSAKTTTVQALPEIIEGLTKMGFSFAALKAGDYGYHHSVSN